MDKIDYDFLEFIFKNEIKFFPFPLKLIKAAVLLGRFKTADLTFYLKEFVNKYEINRSFIYKELLCKEMYIVRQSWFKFYWKFSFPEATNNTLSGFTLLPLFKTNFDINLCKRNNQSTFWYNSLRNIFKLIVTMSQSHLYGEGFYSKASAIYLFTFK